MCSHWPSWNLDPIHRWTLALHAPPRVKMIFRFWLRFKHPASHFIHCVESIFDLLVMLTPPVSFLVFHSMQWNSFIDTSLFGNRLSHRWKEHQCRVSDRVRSRSVLLNFAYPSFRSRQTDRHREMALIKAKGTARWCSFLDLQLIESTRYEFAYPYLRHGHCTMITKSNKNRTTSTLLSSSFGLSSSKPCRSINKRVVSKFILFILSTCFGTDTPTHSD